MFKVGQKVYYLDENNNVQLGEIIATREVKNAFDYEDPKCKHDLPYYCPFGPAKVEYAVDYCVVDKIFATKEELTNYMFRNVG